MLYQKIKRLVILLTLKMPWKHSDICPIMIAYYKAHPEIKNPKNHKCGVPQSRAKYQKMRGICHKDKQHCLPRKETPHIIRRELYGPSRRKRLIPLYGKGYSEHSEDCVVCQAGLWVRCYIEYGENPEIRTLLSQGYVGNESYDELVRRLKARAP